MPTIVKPQVLVFQEFTIVPSEITDPLRAHISGPNADLHRYSDADEKPLINVGAYDRAQQTCYSWPGREAGSVIDEDYTRIFMDAACLTYFEDLIGDFSSGRGANAVVSGRNNWLRSDTVSFKSNGAFLRSGLLNDRDVQIGDKVYIRGVDTQSGAACDEHELDTFVTGFASDEVASSVDSCRADVNNQGTTLESTTITKTGGPDNCVVATADGSAYDGLEDGHVTETYTIEVVKSGVAGCQAARLRVTSASGTDNEDEVVPSDFAASTDIGSRGLTVTFDNTGDVSCSSEASAANVDETELLVGQIWVVSVTMDFETACCESGGTYSGPDDDTYIVEVTKGGTFASLPEITVTTTKGLDFAAPATVTAANVAVPVGSYGVTIKLVDCFGSDSESASSAGEGESEFGGTGDLEHGLLTGDKFYITVISASNGPIRTLILQHDIPVEIRDEADLDLRLFIPRTGLEITENRISAPPLKNWTQESTQACLEAGITAYDPTWTKNGVEQPMAVYDGTVFIQYREWLADKTNEVGAINDIADIDDIGGPLDIDNPLKWGVFKALQNSNGTIVRYTAVLDPTDLDDWQDVIERVDGRDDLYNFVPLSNNKDVHDIFDAHVDSESSPDAGNWKAMFVNLIGKTNSMVVGLSSAGDQLLNPTSTDGLVVLATIADDPNATGTQYTLLTADSGNGGFIEHNVQPGDIVRFLYTIDAFAIESYTEFVVDTVLSEDSLLLLAGNSDPVAEPQKLEIWHTLEKDEVVTDLKGQAQAFSDTRVVATWPDFVGNAGVTQAGYFLNAALAGLVSAVVPHQGLTNVSIAGFDDLASRTIDYFSDSQIDELDDGGVWVATEDRDGTPHTRHALTTDTTDVKTREEMVRRNVDSMSYLFLRRLAPFIGRSNVTPSMLEVLEVEIIETIDFLKTSGFTPELGGQLVDGSIREGFPRVHPLLADRIEVVLDLIVPSPLNNIEVHLVV